MWRFYNTLYNTSTMFTCSFCDTRWRLLFTYYKDRELVHVTIVIFWGIVSYTISYHHKPLLSINDISDYMFYPKRHEPVSFPVSFFFFWVDNDFFSTSYLIVSRTGFCSVVWIVFKFKIMVQHWLASRWANRNQC